MLMGLKLSPSSTNKYITGTLREGKGREEEMQYNILYNSSYFFRRGKRGKPYLQRNYYLKGH
jgi:hypothetical protein